MGLSIAAGGYFVQLEVSREIAVERDLAEAVSDVSAQPAVRDQSRTARRRELRLLLQDGGDLINRIRLLDDVIARTKRIADRADVVRDLPVSEALWLASIDEVELCKNFRIRDLRDDLRWMIEERGLLLKLLAANSGSPS